MPDDKTLAEFINELELISDNHGEDIIVVTAQNKPPTVEVVSPDPDDGDDDGDEPFVLISS